MTQTQDAGIPPAAAPQNVQVPLVFGAPTPGETPRFAIGWTQGLHEIAGEHLQADNTRVINTVLREEDLRHLRHHYGFDGALSEFVSSYVLEQRDANTGVMPEFYPPATTEDIGRILGAPRRTAPQLCWSMLTHRRLEVDFYYSESSPDVRIQVIGAHYRGDFRGTPKAIIDQTFLASVRSRFGPDATKRLARGYGRVVEQDERVGFSTDFPMVTDSNIDYIMRCGD